MGIPSGFDITRDLTFEYTRLPDHVMRWRHWKLHQDDQVLVSAFYDADLPRPMVVDDQTISEKVIHGISYNFWDQWYNVVSVYDGDLVFKGYYSDILTPIQKTWNLVTMTDLFLDFFMFPDGSWTIKDEDEFEEGVAKGYMDESFANRARETLDRIVEWAKAGQWPPDVVGRIPSDPLKELNAVRRLERP
jgi:predicted RNA-binding protein associated with RNAse of E/G family